MSSRCLAHPARYLLLALPLLAACTFDGAGIPGKTADGARDLSGDSPADLERPDAATPDLDAALPKADLSEAALPDAAPDLSDAALPDTTPDLPVDLPDAALPDTTPADLPLPDQALPDLPWPDLALPDLPPPDSYPQPPPNTTYAFAAPPTGITIDGDLTEWTGGWISIASPGDWVSMGGASSGAADISAKLAARWDAAALYLAFEITDDVHSNTYDGDTLYLYQGDSVQIGLDMADNDGPAYDNTDDYEYGWARTNSGNLIRYRWMAPGGSPAMANTFAVTRANSTTRYEIRLPLVDLGVSSLAAGKSVGFSFLANDNDGSSRDGFIEWTSGIGQQKNPGAFGLLTLMP